MRWFTALVVAAVVLVGTLSAQAPYQDTLRTWTPIKHPRVLKWDSLTINRLAILTFGMRFELKKCITGVVRGDTAFTRDMVQPWIYYSTEDAVSADKCPPGTVVFWHNHPWTPKDSLYGFTDYRQLCGMSKADMLNGAVFNAPFVAVSVGVDADSTVLCWWTQEQLRQGIVEYEARIHPYMIPIAGQRMYIDRPRQSWSPFWFLR